MLSKILKMLILNLTKIWRRKFIFQIKTVKKTITDCNLLQKIVIVFSFEIYSGNLFILVLDMVWPKRRGATLLIGTEKH